MFGEMVNGPEEKELARTGERARVLLHLPFDEAGSLQRDIGGHSAREQQSKW